MPWWLCWLWFIWWLRSLSSHEMSNHMKCQMTISDDHFLWPFLMTIIYDMMTMTPSRNTRSYTLRSVPSSPGRSTLTLKNINLDSLDSCSYLAHPSWIAIYLNVHNSIVQLRDHNSCFSVLFVLSSSCLDFKLPYYSWFRPYHTTILLPYYYHTTILYIYNIEYWIIFNKSE